MPETGISPVLLMSGSGNSATNCSFIFTITCLQKQKSHKRTSIPLTGTNPMHIGSSPTARRVSLEQNHKQYIAFLP
jgi:hypothetical protein